MRRAAYYIWTETQLVHAFRIRKYLYPDTSADLFILDAGRISDRALAFLKAHAVFDNLCLIKLPAYCTSTSLWSKLPLLRQVIHSREYIQYFSKTVGQYRPYDLFFTPGFWAESLYFLSAIGEDRLPQIYFFEEGLASYAKDSFRCRIDSSWKEHLETQICFGNIFRRAKKNVCGIYLNCPKLYFCSRPIERFSIPTHRDTPLESELLDCLRCGAPLEEYQKRNVVFISGGLRSDYEPDHRESDSILRCIIAACGAENIIYRAHPTEFHEKGRLSDLSRLGVFVDAEPYWFESIFPSVSWDQKTIITRNSSSVFTLICTEAAFPNLILTYPLYRSYRKNGDPIRSALSQIYSMLYGERRGKICVANHWDKLGEFLASAKSQASNNKASPIRIRAE